MVMTLLGYRVVMAELLIDDRRREARTDRKLHAAGAARRCKGL